jgi:uncharacterized repeat protein (TIGR03803 family)
MVRLRSKPVPIKIHSAESDFRKLPGRESAGKTRCTSYALAFALIPFLAMHIPAQAQTYSDKVLYSFSGGVDGNEPLFSGVVQDKAGNFYGTTYAGGAFNYGTVFKVDVSGKETVLHSFGERRDGRTPIAAVLIDPTGRLFGTTNQGGGIRNPQCTKGCGIVFGIEPNGDERVLHAFSGGADGGLPVGSLIRDSSGNLYGTTQIGGAFGFGTIFKVDASGAETVLYSFAGQPDAQDPEAGLIRDEASNFYGTTSAGGVYNYGAVYELNASGQETVLHSFAGSFYSDGQAPDTTLFRAANGDLYGTTYLGGTEGIGTVFKLDASGNETILHSFGDAENDGAYAESPLASDANGNLYGTTIQGGTAGIPGGIVFRISAQGEYSIICNFTGTPDGSGPAGPLLPASDGRLFGTTSSGGASGPGTVYELIP